MMNHLEEVLLPSRDMIPYFGAPKVHGSDFVESENSAPGLNVKA